MTDVLLSRIKDRYPLVELDVGEFATLRANGMKFSVQAFKAQGLGHVSIMRAKGFFGLMKMDTLMIVPDEKDLPLYSYDRIYAAGNDTLIVELYDTLTAPLDLGALGEIISRRTYLAGRDPGKHWYDDIKLEESISKKGKRAQTPELDALAYEHFEAYLSAPAVATADVSQKKARSAAYVNGLLTHGGPSTDVFKKTLGAEPTSRLFCEVLFGIDGK